MEGESFFFLSFRRLQKAAEKMGFFSVFSARWMGRESFPVGLL